jgi:hypothetical protein
MQVQGSGVGEFSGSVFFRTLDEMLKSDETCKWDRTEVECFVKYYIESKWPTVCIVLV